MRIAKRQYYNNYFEKNVQNSELVWKGIKQIIQLKTKYNYQVPAKIQDGSTEISNRKEMANYFSNYFANIGSKLASSIPKVNNYSPLKYLDKTYSESFYIYPVTSAEIENEISRLKSGKTCEPSSIPIRVMKILKHVISNPLEIVFNASFSQGIVPSNLKIARVTPILKKGIQSAPDNYRPISLLSVFNKILEKRMYKRLLNFVKKHNILYEKQFGFRPHFSTNHAILSIIDKIQQAIEEKSHSCGIFLDFSKAFDTVDQNILIKKIEKYGIRGIANEWFVSYLSNRKHFVTIDNISSDLSPITCGVPQGSVLGPLFFCYIYQ